MRSRNTAAFATARGYLDAQTFVLLVVGGNGRQATPLENSPAFATRAKLVFGGDTFES